MVGALARTSDGLSCLFVLQGWLEHGFLSCVPVELFRALACDFFFTVLQVFTQTSQRSSHFESSFNNNPLAKGVHLIEGKMGREC